MIGLARPAFLPTDNLASFLREVVFTAAIPTADHIGKFAVLLEPAMNDRVVRAFISGVTQVRVNVLDVTHACADVTAGNTLELMSGKSGSAQILWKEDDTGHTAGTGTQWAIVRFASACAGGSSSVGRCDCPEDTYEVNVSCGDCTVMPKYWWLTLSEGTYGACYTGPYSTLCLDGEQSFKLTYNADPYYSDHCLWQGHGRHCLDVELDQIGAYWVITVVDQHGCVLVILRKSVATFNCCGINTGWEIVGGSCEYTATLAPDPCTCCHPPGALCPPDGERTCPDLCCDNVCELTARWSATCPATTCPDPTATPFHFPGQHHPVSDGPLGDCVPQPSCTSSGEVTMLWQGGCTWYGREHGVLAGVPFDRRATWDGGAGTLDISYLMPDGTTCSYHCSGAWSCGPSPTLVCSSCPYGSPGTVTATIDPVPYS